MEWGAIERVDWVAIGGLGVAALTLVFGEVRERRTARGTERRLRQSRATDALAPVVALLDDAHPDRLAFNAGSHTEAVVTRLRERWETTVRGPLLGLAVASPTEHERRLAHDASVAVQTALTVAFAQALHFGSREARDPVWTHEEAQHEHERAMQIVEELASAVRQDKTRRLRSWRSTASR